MICERPFIRSGPHGTKKIIALSDADSRLQVTPFPCGSCLPCRIEKQKVWKLRISLEAHLNMENLFITLTYDDEHLPEKSSLVPNDLTLYFKRLRKALYPKKFRYFAVGEYGESGVRKINPHYHIIAFGIGQSDLKKVSGVWRAGFEYFGEVNEKSIGYITGYVTKGIKDAESMTYYAMHGLNPEFMRSSKGGPGGLGIEVIKCIAKKLKESGHYDGNPIYSIKLGRKRWPLGRYLTIKLAEFLETDREAFNADFWAYQAAIILKHQKGDSIYVHNIIEENEGKRNSKVKRNRIFGAKKKI